MHPSGSSIPEQATLSLAAGDQVRKNGSPQIRIQQHEQWHASLCPYNIFTLSTALVTSSLLGFWTIQDSGHCLQSSTWRRSKLLTWFNLARWAGMRFFSSKYFSRRCKVYIFLINWILIHRLWQELTDRVVIWGWCCGLSESDWTKVIQPAFKILSPDL